MVDLARELVSARVIAELLGDRRALGEREHLLVGALERGGGVGGGGKRLVGLSVLAQQQQRGALRDQRRGTPLARVGQFGECGLGVEQHPVRALPAEPRLHDGAALADRPRARSSRGRGAANGGLEPSLGLVGATPESVDPAPVERDRRVALEKVGPLEPPEPPLERHDAAGPVDGERDRGEDRGGAVQVSGRVGVLEGRLGVAVRLEPVRGPPVQGGNDLRLVLEELALQELPEKVVVAVPDATVVERDEKQVRALDPLELAVGAAVVEHRVAEVAAHLLEHRRPAEEPQGPRPHP